MKFITKPYEENVGFESMSDEELFLINGGSMSGVIEVIGNIGEFIGEVLSDAHSLLTTIGSGGGVPDSPRIPDLSTKNPNHPANQHCY